MICGGGAALCLVRLCLTVRTVVGRTQQCAGGWERDGSAYVVKLEIPQPLPGLTLEVPEGWTLDRGRSSPVSIDQAGRFVILQEAVGAMALRFMPSHAGAPRKHGT